jgi:hypothetical protein
MLACARARYVCPAAPAPANIDSLYTSTAPLRPRPDSSVSPDSIVGVVLRAGARSPVRNAQVRFRHDTTLQARTDSAGRFSLPTPSVRRVVLETRVVGYLTRRDSLNVAALGQTRLEVTLLDAYALGDVQGVPICTPVPRK